MCNSLQGLVSQASPIVISGLKAGDVRPGLLCMHSPVIKSVRAPLASGRLSDGAPPKVVPIRRHLSVAQNTFLPQLC